MKTPRGPGHGVFYRSKRFFRGILSGMKSSNTLGPEGAPAPAREPMTGTQAQVEQERSIASAPTSRGSAYPYLRQAIRNALALGIAESAMLVVCLLLGAYIRFQWKGETMFASWMLYLVAAWVIGTFMTKLLPGWGLGPVEELRRSVLLLVGVFAGTTAMLFWGQAAQATSRFTLTTGFLLSLFLVPMTRLQVKRMLIQRGLWGIPVAVYADAMNGRMIVEALDHERGLGYIPACFFSDDPALVRRGAYGLHVWGSSKENTLEMPVAVLALPGIPRESMVDRLENTLSVYRKVIVIPDMHEAPSLWVKPRHLVRILGLEISSNLLDPTARLIKRSADLVIITALAPVWVPLCLLIALLVWLEDRHSPLFRQERVGRFGQPFVALKFRTMHTEAESLLRRKLDEDPGLRAEWESNFKLRKDPRITLIGRFLRRTSLDEFPQLINVLKGEMSLVGPRPLPKYHFDELPERVKKLRHRVRPGLTGLWQVSGRSEAGHAGMTKWDTYYVRNWSIWLDIVILVRTFRAVASGRGAF